MNNTRTPSTGKQYSGFDLLKFFAAICVVVIHTDPLSSLEEGSFLSFCRTLVRLAVPFFFMVSSFLLASGFRADWRSVENAARIRKWVKHMLQNYLFYSVLYLPITLYGALRIDQTLSIQKIVTIAIRYLVYGEQWYSWQLWYLLVCVYVGILLLLCNRLFSEKTTKYLFLGAYLLSFAATYLIQAYAAESFIFNSISVFIERICGALGYFSVGLFFARREKRPPLSACAITLLLGAVLAFLTPFTGIALHTTPLLLIVVCALFVLAEAIPEKKIRHAARLRRMSTSIYFTHMAWYFLGGLLFWGFEEANGFLPFLWTLALSLAAALCTAVYKETGFRKKNGAPPC